MRRGREALLFALAIAACGGDRLGSPDNHGSSNIAPPPNGVAQFTMLPVSIASGKTLTALGNLNPPGHVLPTDHVYFYDWDLSVRGASQAGDDRTVYMPTTGTVVWVIKPTGTDTKVMFRVTENFYFYLDHLLPSMTFTMGQVVSVGTPLGHTGPGGTLDLGAFDMSVSHSGFVNPARYPDQTLHYVSPWKYFTPELQAQISSHLYRVPSSADLDGRIDFGVKGTLAGDWFLKGMPVDSSSGPYGWTRSISFAYDYYDPSQVRLSIGGTVSAPGVWGIEPTAPRPAAVTPASGVIAYKLYSIFDVRPPYGVLLVQMIDDSTIKVEVFMDSNASATQFDGREVTFVR
ncbi:MAG TPA: hypothetical protein VIP11_02285 [Gemmatimonadaceae bacterium]